MVQVELSDVAQRSIVLVMFCRWDDSIAVSLGTDQNTASTFQISLRVREPFGADQVIAITSRIGFLS